MGTPLIQAPTQATLSTSNTVQVLPVAPLMTKPLVPSSTLLRTLRFTISISKTLTAKDLKPLLWPPTILNKATMGWASTGTKILSSPKLEIRFTESAILKERSTSFLASTLEHGLIALISEYQQEEVLLPRMVVLQQVMSPTMSSTNPLLTPPRTLLPEQALSILGALGANMPEFVSRIQFLAPSSTAQVGKNGAPAHQTRNM